MRVTLLVSFACEFEVGVDPLLWTVGDGASCTALNVPEDRRAGLGWRVPPPPSAWQRFPNASAVYGRP